MGTHGTRTWCFPDGYIPKMKGNLASGFHETLMTLNAGRQVVYIAINTSYSGIMATNGDQWRRVAAVKKLYVGRLVQG